MGGCKSKNATMFEENRLKSNTQENFKIQNNRLIYSQEPNKKIEKSEDFDSNPNLNSRKLVGVQEELISGISESYQSEQKFLSFSIYKKGSKGKNHSNNSSIQNGEKVLTPLDEEENKNLDIHAKDLKNRINQNVLSEKKIKENKLLNNQESLTSRNSPSDNQFNNVNNQLLKNSNRSVKSYNYELKDFEEGMIKYPYTMNAPKKLIKSIKKVQKKN